MMLFIGNRNTRLSRGGKSLREAADVVGDFSFGAQKLDVGTVLQKLTSGALLDVLLATERGEPPVLGDNDLLATRELVLGAAESLDGGSTMSVTGADRQDDLANVHTGDGTVGLAPGTTHTGLEPIGSGTGQHLVDADDMEGVGADSHVETILSSNLDKVLVGANTGGFESLRGKLFVLVGDQVDAQGELVDTSPLAAQIKDLDLGIGDTTVESRLGVRLVLAVTVATSGTAGHF